LNKAQQKQIPQEPILPQSVQSKPEQQKTWWKERLKTLANGAKDTFNAVKNAAYRYWQSKAQ
jgi:hypothetical protein